MHSVVVAVPLVGASIIATNGARPERASRRRLDTLSVHRLSGTVLLARLHVSRPDLQKDATVASPSLVLSTPARATPRRRRRPPIGTWKLNNGAPRSDPLGHCAYSEQIDFMAKTGFQPMSSCSIWILLPTSTIS
jgi:hypothetical protein